MLADEVVKRYSLLTKLGEGGMGTVYAAYDRLKKEQVALKKIREKLGANWDAHDTADKILLAQEFQILASLKHPHIISVIDFGFEETNTNPYFTMTLLDSPQTVVKYGLGLSLEQRIDLILQMLLAIAYLHRNGIIHRDLKPDNALVTTDGRLRVLDFGIAIPEHYENDKDIISGTLAYIAPEAIMGEPITPASDLYAIGVMAYELFAGRHPFDLHAPHLRLIQDVIGKEPDLEILQTRLQKVVRGGIGYLETDEVKKADIHASEVFKTLPISVDKGDKDSVDDNKEAEKTIIVERDALIASEIIRNKPSEAGQGSVSEKKSDREISGVVYVINRLLAKDPRERYQHAEDVIQILCEIFNRPVPNDVAIRESYLQAAKFVGRETEIGILRHSLEQTIANNGGKAWLVGGESGVGKSRLLNELRIEALVRGAIVLDGQGVVDGGLHYQLWREPLRRLIVTVGLSDIEAGILKAIIPDIEDLLGRNVQDAPALEETGKDRLIATISSIFHKTQQPIALFLEDLQWSTESLDVLKALVPLVEQRALIIFGSYRSDERSGMPDELPMMNHLHLERLDNQSIEALSESMLGSVGRNREFIELLKRETEGNVFFLVEVVRALAQEAGNLNRIGELKLPERVFSGGIQQIVQRRFERVPETAHYPLRFVAIAGREINLEMLQTAIPGLDIEIWLTECSAAAVIEVKEGQWRFAHEKLREGLIASFDKEERQAMHHQVADTLAKLYGDLPDYAQFICDHYEKANAPEKAAQWYVPAGVAARNAYVGVSATAYFEKAIYYWASHPERMADFSNDDLSNAYLGLGTMYFWQGRYDDAIGIFEALQALATDTNNHDELAHALRWIANCRLYQGNGDTAKELLDQAELVAERATTNKPLAQILWVRGIISYMSGDFPATLELGKRILALAEESGIQNLLTQGNNLLGAVNYALGNYKDAETHWQKQYEISVTIADNGPAMSALNNLGLIAEALGDYETAHKRYNEALNLIYNAGIRDQHMLFLSNLGGVQVRQEDFDLAIANLKKVIEMAETTPFGQLSETYRFLAEALLATGDPHQALDAAQHAMELADGVGSPDMIAGAWRVLGQVASKFGKSIFPTSETDMSFNANECFQKSIDIYAENGMMGDQARTTREWSRHMQQSSQVERGRALWQEAITLFEQLGAELEVQRMKARH